MQTPAPTLRSPRTLILGRGWLLPASLVALILAGSYLPAHGVAGLLDIAASTIAALGLVAASIAAPRWIRRPSGTRASPSRSRRPLQRVGGLGR